MDSDDTVLIDSVVRIGDILGIVTDKDDEGKLEIYSNRLFYYYNIFKNTGIEIICQPTEEVGRESFKLDDMTVTDKLPSHAELSEEEQQARIKFEQKRRANKRKKQELKNRKSIHNEKDYDNAWDDIMEGLE